VGCRPDCSRGRCSRRCLQAIPWSAEDDRKLAKLVETFGEKDWCMVASVIVGRTPRQCRERFKNHVKEGIRKGPWSNEEDAAILQVQTREFSREGRGAATGSGGGAGGGQSALPKLFSYVFA
jgi:hypothetical protein